VSIQRVGGTRGQLRADFRQYAGNAEAGDAHGVGAHHDVAQMQQPVMHAAIGRVIDGGRERLHERGYVAHRHRPTFAQYYVNRIADGILVRKVRGAVLEARGDRSGDVRMIDICGDERIELVDERSGLFRCEVETKNFDRDEPIASRLVCAEDRTQRTRTNLMENPERPERFRRKVQDRIFAVQRSNGNINSLHIPVDIRRFPWIKKLAADYAFQFSALAPFFSGDPSVPASWNAAIANVQKHPRQRAELSALLIRQLERRDAPAAAREAAARLAEPQTVAIVTGQQAGLFGGPLFTLYKGLTAAKLAAKLSTDHGTPAVAVFWVESEDHDWDEVASVSILDHEMQRRTITLPPPEGAGHAPIGTIKIGSEIGSIIDELASALPPTEFTAELIGQLRDAYTPGITMSDAFARVLDRTLGELGVIVFECSDRAAKPLVRDIFAHEIRHAGRTWSLAGDAGERLAAGGYHTQVEGSSHGAALFRIDGSRRAIEAFDGPGLADEVRTHPETFSPNVLLRPIVEDALFPTVCYVSGPNELAYLAQLRAVYEHFGVPMPLMYPRASATVLDSASARFLEKHDLPFEALQARDESALNRLLAASLPESVDRALKEAEEAIQVKMAAIVASVPAIDATLEGAAKSTLGKLQHDLSTLRGKVIGAAKKRDETLRRQFFRAQAQAFPDGLPQERALGSVALINRYGPALVQRLMQELPLDLGHHWVLTL
jgi:bacillithiol synthase